MDLPADRFELSIPTTDMDLLTLDALTNDERKLCALRIDDDWVTYGDLADRVLRVRPKFERVKLAALVAQADLPSVVWLHACLTSATPVLLIHPRLPPAERERLLARTGASLLLDGALGLEIGEAKELPEPLLPGDQVLVPTSGSSGIPKIAVLTRAGLLAAARSSNQNLALDPRDCWALSLPFAHVGGLSVLTRCLIARATVRILSANSLDALGEGAYPDVTHVSLVPTQLRRWLERRPGIASTIRHVLLGGAPIPGALRVRARRGGYPLLCTYGMTEMGSQIATQSSSEKRPPSPGEQDVGRPIPGVDVRVAADGELQVRGPQLARTYWGSSTPLTDADGYFHTGDVGCLDAEGRVVVSGRKDHLLISGGENVAPELVEAALLDHEAVAEACVVGVPDEEWGTRIVAVVRWSDKGLLDREVSAASVQEHLRGRLPGFAVPKRLVPWGSFPLLSSGKVDRQAVQAQIAREMSGERSC